MRHRAFSRDIDGAFSQANIDKWRDMDTMHDMRHASASRCNPSQNPCLALMSVNDIGTIGPEELRHVLGCSQIRQGVNWLDEALDALKAHKAFEPSGMAGIMVPTVNKRNLVSALRLTEARCDNVLLRSCAQESCHDMHDTMRFQNQYPTTITNSLTLIR